MSKKPNEINKVDKLYSLPETTVQVIEQAAAAEGRTYSEIVNRAIMEKYGSQKRNHKGK